MIGSNSHHERRKLSVAEVCPRGSCRPTTSTTIAPPTSLPSRLRWRESRKPRRACGMCTNAPAILLIGNDPTEQHPLLAWQIRNNVRLHGARLYIVNSAADQAAAAGGQLHPDSAGRKRSGCIPRGRSIPRWRQQSLRRQSRLRATRCATSCAAKRIWLSFSDRKFAARPSLRW